MGVKAPGVVAVGVAFAVFVEEEDVDDERSERPTARRKRSLSGIAVLVGLFSSKVEEEIREEYRGALVMFFCLVCTPSVTGLDWTDFCSAAIRRDALRYIVGE